MINYLYVLLKLYPDFNWDYNTLYKNPDISLEIILELFPIDLDKLSRNPNMTPDLNTPVIKKILKKRKTQDKPPDIIDDVYMNLWYGFKVPADKWNYFLLNKHMKINVNTFKKYQFDWNYEIISRRSDIDMETLNYCISNMPQDVEICNKLITWDFISKNMNRSWDWEYVLYFVKLTPEIIRENINLWEEYTDGPCHILCCNSGVTYEMLNIIEPEPDLWDWEALSQFMNINEIYKRREYEEYIDYDSLSLNSTLTWKTVKKNMDKSWNWGVISNRFGAEKRTKKYLEIGVKNNIKIINDLFNGKHNYKTCKLLQTRDYFNLMIKKKYWNLWKKKIRNIKKQREKWQMEYSASIDFIKNQLFY